MKTSTCVFFLGIGASPHHGTWSLNLLTFPQFIYCPIYRTNAFKSFITSPREIEDFILLFCWVVFLCQQRATMQWDVFHVVCGPWACDWTFQRACTFRKAVFERRHLVLLHLQLLICVHGRIIFLKCIFIIQTHRFIRFLKV